MDEYARRWIRILPVFLAILTVILVCTERSRAAEWEKWEKPPNLAELCAILWPEDKTLFEACVFLQPGSYTKIKKYRASRVQDAYVDMYLTKCTARWRVKKHPHLINWRLAVGCVEEHMEVVENFRLLIKLGRDYKSEEEFSRTDCLARYPDNELSWLNCYQFDGGSVPRILKLQEAVGADACMADIIPKCLEQSSANEGPSADWGSALICIQNQVAYVKKLRIAGELQILDLKNLQGCE